MEKTLEIEEIKKSVDDVKSDSEDSEEHLDQEKEDEIMELTNIAINKLKSIWNIYLK